jgi:hypothetical protein
MQEQGEWMPSGIRVDRVSQTHAKLLGEFARSIIADDPGYSYEGKATYVKMVYDVQYVHLILIIECKFNVRSHDRFDTYNTLTLT